LYFLIEPKCVEVTITWGAMTFTYAGSQWNVETLTWEGIWTPTNDPNSPAADMDGYDDTLASNQIKVVNSGTVTVNVSFRFDSDGSFTNSYGTVNGAFKTTSVRKKPYYLSNWDAVDSSQFPYIWNKAYFRAETDANEDITVSYGGKTNIEEIAQALKAKFDTYPDNANMRILNVKSLETQFMVKTADDVIFMEDGTAAMAAWMRVFLAEYSRIGGKLDGVHSDLEYIDGYSQYLYNAYEAGDTGIYDKIVANDAYTSKVRPKLEERGFEFYDGPDSDNEIWSTRFYTDEKYKQCRYIWDVVISNMYADYLTEAFYEPLQEYYPDAWFDDWETRDAYGWMKEIPESGHTMYLGGNYKKAGNYSNYSYYNYAPSTQWVDESESDTTTYMKPTSHNDAVYEDNAFNMTMWEVNTSKNMYAATDTKQIAIHLTFYDWALLHSANGQEGSSNTPYHVESYFHSGLLDPLFGGYFILKEASGEPDVEEDTDAAAYALRLQVASEILAELNRVAGYADRKPIETPANWNDSFILSGMYAGGRNIWRITPDTITGVSRETFLLYENENEVVFYNKGQRITFPQGNIIADSVISEVGTCGYWVETPADVMPIVTNEADRYEEYPAYVETFDNYTVDEAFSSQYSHTWELGDSSATIQQNGDDKFLAIQGNATLNNVKLPEYITAGDNYAKQQAWELSFRLSALPSGNGELKLLTASSGGSNADGGFCISNNTLYYSTASGYQAFNITLDDNTEYTVKRVFDFRTVNSFTCSYYVYDANGELLGNAEDVVISSLSLPVQKIGISTANFGSNTLYVDDYKLYATGVTTDLEVYNADTGIQVDASVPREGNTAYRLSWMNASSDTKIYNVVATYSDGTKEILNSIEMLPGCDGVNTGIVKVNDKSVTISLEETDTKVPDAGDNAGDDGSSNGSNSASGEATTITLIRFQEADAYLYLSSGYVATFNERKTLGTVTVVIDALSPAQGGNA